MADEESFDIGRDLPVFLALVLDKTECAKMMRAKGLPKRTRKLSIKVSGCLDR